MAVQQSSFEAHDPSPDNRTAPGGIPAFSTVGAAVQTATEPRITEIDIGRPARALAILRWSDYVLVVMCGLTGLAMVPEVALAAGDGRWADVVASGAFMAVFAFACYTGWRHVGVIDPRVWTSHLWIFPLLMGVAAVMALATLATWESQGAESLENVQTFLTAAVGLQFAIVAVPGFLCVVWLRRTRIGSPGRRLDELLRDLAGRAGGRAASVTAVERVNPRRGYLYAIAGGLVLAVVTFAPLPEGQQATTGLRLAHQLNLFGFFLIVRSRRYFQVSADALLAVDKRRPILFLRSFADDERQQYGSSQRALLDFSLETRLANHFHCFGPFIAIGSPKETVPQPGAARVLLGDDEWQGRVLGWMKEANLIIMYCGTTQWVNWELRQVIESGRATSLILMFPEIKGWRPSRRRRDITARAEQIRSVFTGTPWSEELMAFSDFAGLRAMLFRADGSMVMVKSRSRSRDAYHLAALIAHQQLLDPSITGHATITARAARPRRLRVAAGGLAAAGVVLAALYSITPDPDAGATPEPPPDARLAFKQGELYFSEPVTEAEARGVGTYLVGQQVFSDENALTVRLSQQQGLYKLGFVIKPGHADDVLVAVQFAALGSDVAREVLGGKPLEVALYDQQLTEIKTLPTSAKLAFGKGELYYTDPVTLEDARKVGEHLLQVEFFTQEATVHLGREQEAYQLRFVIDPSRAGDPVIIEAFTDISAGLAAQALGGSALVMHLCDSEFRTLTSRRLDAVGKGNL